MRLSTTSISEMLLYLIRKSVIIAKFYSHSTLLYCKYIKIKSNVYDALLILCDVQRRVPDMNITKKCTDMIERIIQENCCSEGKLLPIGKNRLLEAFYRSSRFKLAREAFKHDAEMDRLHLRHTRTNDNPQRQGNMIILKKPNKETGEKGVIVLNYSPTFEHFLALFDIKSLSNEYRMVFEPSSYRNIEASLFLYSGFELTHVLQAAQNDDKTILEKLTSSIITVDLGSGDWTDINSFLPTDNEKIYDIVMVASWLKLKRHELLFKSLRELKRRGRNLRVALIGYPMDMIRADIVRMANKYGVHTSCDIYENISPQEVAKIVSSSKVALHLSKYEGTNRASYEAWLCNVPLIVYRHNVGFRNTYVNSYTGLLSDDKELPDMIEYVLNNPDSFSPRGWILEHSGYLSATFKLNEILKQIAVNLGEPWTVDIVAKRNGPNFLYVDEQDRISIESAYLQLQQYVYRFA